MPSSKAAGFTFTEAMISVAILGIIASIAGYSLRTSQQRDELNNGGRIVAADLRDLQARALTAQNTKFCSMSGIESVCENSTAGCTDTCTAVAPAGVGIHITKNSASYSLFAKYDPNTTDWRESSAFEIFQTRDLGMSGAPNVKITDISSVLVPYDTVDVAFQRQSGGMLIDSCPSGCTNQSTLTITLTHSVSGKQVKVTLNKTTGRISFEQ